MSRGEPVSKEELENLYALVLDLVETVTNKLYRHTLERLRTINPTLEEIEELCNMFVRVVENESGWGIDAIKEAAGVLREAAVAVSRGDDGLIKDCAYHLEDATTRFKRMRKG